MYNYYAFFNDFSGFQSIMTGTSTVTAMEQTIPDISDMMATSPVVYFLTDGRQQSIPVEPGRDAASK
jgi:hypothetical protein